MRNQSLEIQEAYFSDFDYWEIEMYEAQKDSEYNELRKKSMWIRELLDDFKVENYGEIQIKGRWYNGFFICVRGLEKVDITQFTVSREYFCIKKELVATTLSKEEFVEQLAIACYLELEKNIDTEIPNHETDEEQQADELPF